LTCKSAALAANDVTSSPDKAAVAWISLRMRPSRV
jgi:hypothetical protein